jgi:hypothetical protein
MLINITSHCKDIILDKTDTYMLTQSPNNIATLLRPSSILQQSIDHSLLDLTAPSPLNIGNLDKRLIDAFDSEWFRFPKSEALLFLGFERNIACITNFVVESLERLAIQATDIFQSFGNCGSSESEF